MNPNLDIHAPWRIRQEGGLGGLSKLQINVQGADSDGSDSTHFTGSSPSSTSTSRLVQAILVVQNETTIHRHDEPVLIGTVNDESFAKVWNAFEVFRDSLEYKGCSTSHYVLSGGSQSEVMKPFYHKTHLDEAVTSYQSRDYTTFEIWALFTPERKRSRTSARQQLQERLSGAKVHCKPDDHGWFIPSSKLEEILNVKDMEALFNEDAHFSSLPDNFVRDRGLKLLATFLLAGISPLGERLIQFKEAGLLDAEMPFNPQCRPGFVNAVDYDNICKNQWHTTPLDLKPYNEMIKEPLNKSMIIPITEMLKLNGGGFGDVFKVLIHPDHQHIIDVNRYLALKKPRKNAEKAGTAGFDREFAALVHISGQQNPHLMPLLTAFQHGEDFYLLFPLADCNLKDCFERNHVGNTQVFNWMVGQLAGLASGIYAIHDGNTSGLAVPAKGVIGYHHDLKPENILLSRLARGGESRFSASEMTLGRLQISDFGMGRFRDAETGSKSLNIKGTPAYAAPESELEKLQSRPYDIWSFGCIILEILIWLVKGPQGRQEFLESKKTAVSSEIGAIPTEAYWVRHGNDGRVNPAVMDHMGELRRQKVSGAHDAAVNDLLDVIKDCLQVSKERRPKAGALAARIKRIYENLPT